MGKCVGWSVPLFFATLATVFMFHSVSQVESAHMHSLAIASTAGLYKMINFIYIPHRPSNEIARI